MRPHFLAARMLILAALTLATALMASPAAAATRTPMNVNLLQNASGDVGYSDKVYPDTVVTIPHWKQTSTFSLVTYGFIDFPNAYPGMPFTQAHEQMFVCGNATPGSHASQTVKLRGRNAAIDAGHVHGTIGGWLSSYSDHDRGRLVLAFLNAKGKTIRQISTGWVSQANDAWVHLEQDSSLPRGTRQLRATMQGQRKNGTYCDAYFDALNLEIS